MLNFDFFEFFFFRLLTAGAIDRELLNASVLIHASSGRNIIQLVH